MKERAKSVLLCLLVLCSLILTYQLWFGQRPLETTAESDYEPVYFDETRPLSQMIHPQRIYIYREEKRYQVRRGEPGFDFFWEELSELLQEMAELDYYYDKEGLLDGAALFISMQFEPHLPLGPESIWLKSRRGGQLAGLEIWRWEERYWAKLEEAGGAAPLLLLPPGWAGRLAGLYDRFEPQPEQLCELLPAGEIMMVRQTAVKPSESVCVPAAISRMKRYSLKKERLDEEALLKTFFINRNLVREIKEKDGGLIYTDGEQGLRLERGLEYSHPQPGQKRGDLSYPAALLKVGKLLGYHGGWPNSLYLENLERQERSGGSTEGLFRAQWRSYLDGFLLLGDNGVEMTYQHGLQSYRRNLYEHSQGSGAGVKVEGYQDALRAAVKSLQGKGEQQLILEGLDLAYYLEGTEAVPVWVVRLSGEVIPLKTDKLVPPEGWKP